MKESYITSSDKETRKIGEEIAKKLSPGVVLTFQGELGAGKTTLAQGLLSGLGAKPPYISPTFVIMKLYETDGSIQRIYHVDAYRVEEKDLRELGFKEWCEDKEGIIIIEWPEKAKNLLPQKRIEISLRSLSENEREIMIQEVEYT